MANKPLSLTPQEVKEIVQIESAASTSDIAESVFKQLFAAEEIKMSQKVSQMIYGGAIATVLVLIAIFASTWLFMSSYQQNYLDTQAFYNQQFNDLKKGNADTLDKMKNDTDRIKDKQDYLEKLFLEKTLSPR